MGATPLITTNNPQNTRSTKPDQATCGSSTRATTTPHQTNFARNFQRSFFKHARKRCNPNDLSSRLKAPSRELRAKFLETTRPQDPEARPHGHQMGELHYTGIRHAARRLHVVQKPHPFPHVGHHVPLIPGRGAGMRENTRPTQPLQRHFRDKVRPASPKTPILGCFQRDGRTFSRSRTRQAKQGERLRTQDEAT